ncbi:hypothetical protein BDN72DRAFT_864792 [Pluteus cervinus]|uniref:Uncharacterized protein n=1 Tax=Pluteus cervinus TaxID=181527 RepID=A0ACD3A2L1_9AGAR|nr:hypothetical protein BDN72DRAFT_864792 [Pluteus cervinus]
MPVLFFLWTLLCACTKTLWSIMKANRQIKKATGKTLVNVLAVIPCSLRAHHSHVALFASYHLVVAILPSTMQNKDNSQVLFSNSNVANYITNTNNNNSTQINILPAPTLPQDPTVLHGGSDPKALQERIKMLDDVQKKLQGNYLPGDTTDYLQMS